MELEKHRNDARAEHELRKRYPAARLGAQDEAEGARPVSGHGAAQAVQEARLGALQQAEGVRAARALLAVVGGVGGRPGAGGEPGYVGARGKGAGELGAVSVVHAPFTRKAGNL